MKIGTQYYWYHNDHLGTPQMMTTSSGAVVWKAKYTAFGKATVDASSTIVNPLRFPGQYEDAETGFHYNYLRFYDPANGRYIKTDPIGISGGINLFLYTSGNPLNDFDPKGDFAITVEVVIVIAVGIVVTAIAIEHMRRHPPGSLPIPDYPGEKHKYKRHRQPPKIKDVPDPLPPPDNRDACDRLRDFIQSRHFKCNVPPMQQAITIAMHAACCGPFDASTPSN